MCIHKMSQEHRKSTSNGGEREGGYLWARDKEDSISSWGNISFSSSHGHGTWDQPSESAAAISCWKAAPRLPREWAKDMLITRGWQLFKTKPREVTGKMVAIVAWFFSLPKFPHKKHTQSNLGRHDQNSREHTHKNPGGELSPQSPQHGQESQELG